MKNTVKHKLQSQGGDSLLIALLYFLAAMMVGAVVLTAAATNAGRLARNRQEQQNYLAVASAARLVARDLRNANFSAGYKEVVTETTTITTPPGGEPATAVTPAQTEYTGDFSLLTGSTLLSDEPAAGLKTLYFSTLPEEIPFRELPPGLLVYDLKFTAQDMPTVTGTMAVDTTGPGSLYAITVTLYIEKDGEKLNATTLRFTAQVTGGDSTTVSETTDEVKVPDSADPAADPPPGTTVKTTTVTTTTTYTAAVTWAEPEITKGVTS